MPSELLPKIRTKPSAIRRASPVLISEREMKKAASTSQLVGSAYPARATCGVVFVSRGSNVTAISTSAPPAIGWSISPATVARKMPVSRQPSGVTDAGRAIP